VIVCVIDLYDWLVHWRVCGSLVIMVKNWSYGLGLFIIMVDILSFEIGLFSIMVDILPFGIGLFSIMLQKLPYLIRNYVTKRCHVLD
jgi:hypothetical protein